MAAKRKRQPQDVLITQSQGIVATSSRTARDYLSLAVEIASGSDPRLAITHGPPGAGKTFASQRLLETAGAIRIRSDVERKRLFGLSPLQASSEHVNAGIYDLPATQKTYAELRTGARKALESGWPTIVDAAFLKRAERTEFDGLALSMGAPSSSASSSCWGSCADTCSSWRETARLALRQQLASRP